MRELCEQHGILRPIDLARQAGISKAYAHLLWTGKRLVGRKMALKLAPVFKVPPETLIMLEAPRRQ
jgi:transcriptional regulator with XRE-family HTH domain